MKREARPLLLVSETASHVMMEAARQAHPDETGGILIGVQQDDRPWVTHAVEIASADRGRRHYKLPGGSTQPAVRAARAVDPRVGYLGDWHSHPADVGPSSIDLATLARISLTHPRTPNPTLLIVRRIDETYVLDARRIVAVQARGCDIHLAGDLPPMPYHDPEKP